MSLAVERAEGHSLWLVALDPKGPSRKIAKFIDAEAVGVWLKVHNDAILAARETGRSGL